MLERREKFRGRVPYKKITKKTTCAGKIITKKSAEWVCSDLLSLCCPPPPKLARQDSKSLLFLVLVK